MSYLLIKAITNNLSRKMVKPVTVNRNTRSFNNYLKDLMKYLKRKDAMPEHDKARHKASRHMGTRVNITK